MKLDVIVKTIVLFTPVSVETREWFAENVVAERWQWRGEGLGVDQQPAQGLRGMERRGVQTPAGGVSRATRSGRR
jgi:hypothetical protein